MDALITFWMHGAFTNYQFSWDKCMHWNIEQVDVWINKWKPGSFGTYFGQEIPWCSRKLHSSEDMGEKGITKKDFVVEPILFRGHFKLFYTWLGEVIPMKNEKKKIEINRKSKMVRKLQMETLTSKGNLISAHNFDFEWPSKTKKFIVLHLCCHHSIVTYLLIKNFTTTESTQRVYPEDTLFLQKIVIPAKDRQPHFGNNVNSERRHGMFPLVMALTSISSTTYLLVFHISQKSKFKFSIYYAQCIYS